MVLHISRSVVGVNIPVATFRGNFVSFAFYDFKVFGA